jgi:hypothetical protein
MKPRELFKVLRKHLDPWLTEQGFAQASDPYHRGGVGWTRPRGANHLNIWCLNNKWPFDPFLGSEFTIEVEISPQAIPGFAPLQRFGRLHQLLGEDDRRAMLERHNAVVAKLRQPSDEEYERVVGVPPFDFRGSFAKKFASRVAPIENEDFWMRYYDSDDATLWAKFILETMDRAIAVLESRATD